MFNDNDLKRIDQYLSGQLSPTEIKEFEERLKKDEILTQEFKMRQTMYLYLKKKKSIDEGIVAIKTIGQQYNIAKPNPTAQRKISVWKVLTGVAAVGLTVALAYHLAFKEPRDYYAQYADHSSISIQLSHDNQSAQQNAVQYYNSKDYLNALPFLEQYQTQDPAFAMAKAISMLETAQYTKAEQLFNTIAEQQPIYRPKVHWYLILLNVKQEKYTEALLDLEKIDSSSDFFEKAKNLKKDIQSDLNN